MKIKSKITNTKIEAKDGIPFWFPNAGCMPPTLSRYRGDDLCGDIMMRVRSKIIKKKWKRTFFQIHNSAIATYASIEDWLRSRKPYWIVILSAELSVRRIEEKIYDGITMHVFKLIRDADGEMIAKFGFASQRNIKALHEEMKMLLDQSYLTT